MINMKCSSCGYENKSNAKFCTKCGGSLVKTEQSAQASSSNNLKYIIAILVVVIVVLGASIGYFALNSNSGSVQDATDSQVNESSAAQSDAETPSTDVVSSQKTTTKPVEDSKSWKSIGSYSGSGSGLETISVPPGKIMVKLSAYPIKNYATNHLYVTGSNGESGGVDWGSKSAVETRSDSFTYTSSSSETFNIDYYETVNWEVEFFIYQ